MGGTEQAGAAARKARLKALIAELSLLKDRSFKLASGQTSAFYFDLKRTMLDPEGANLIADEILDLLADDPCDAIGGMAVGAVPIVAAVCVKSLSRRPLRAFYVRAADKGHGTESAVGGHLEPGARVVLVEDVTTSGGSVMKAVEAVRARGAKVSKVITVVDRLAGARDHLAKHGIELVALFTRDDFV